MTTEFLVTTGNDLVFNNSITEPFYSRTGGLVFLSR